MLCLSTSTGCGLPRFWGQVCSVFKSTAPWPQTPQLCHNDNALISIKNNIRNWLCKAGSEARGALMRSLTANPGSSVVQISPDTAVGWTYSYNFLQHRWKDSMEAIGEEGGAGPGLCWLQCWTCGSRSLLLQPPPNSSIATIFQPFQHFPLAISWRFGHASFCLASVSEGAVTLWSMSISPQQCRQPSTSGPGGYCSADLCQACANKVCYHWPTI